MPPSDNRTKKHDPVAAPGRSASTALALTAQRGPTIIVLLRVSGGRAWPGLDDRGGPRQENQCATARPLCRAADPAMAEAEALHALRPFLRNWVWEHGRVGTRYLECASGEVRFDAGKKAHFAGETHIYVSLLKDAEPATRVAPLIHEGGLARFLRAAQQGRPGDAGSPAEVQRAVEDCIELALVSAYQRDAEQAHARYAQEPMFDDEIRAAVIEDVRRVWVGVREQLMRYDVTIFHGLPQALLISDTPFIDWRVRAKPALPFVSLPLGPYSLLVGTPSARTSRSAPPLWKEAPAMGPFRDHNRLQIESARRWLVAISDEMLAAAQSRFAPPKIPTPDQTDGPEKSAPAA